jgi:hypothetical protein
LYREIVQQQGRHGNARVTVSGARRTNEFKFGDAVVEVEDDFRHGFETGASATPVADPDSRK